MKPIGRFALTRSLLFEHWLAENDDYLLAWIKIIATVNFKDKETMNFGICKRGCSFNSLDTWASILKWNKSKVRRFFTLLKKHHMIEQKATHKTTHLTICNYDTYQFGRHDDGHDSGTIVSTMPTPIEEGEQIPIKKKKKDTTQKIDEYSEVIEKLIRYLNKLTGRNFRESGDLRARLKDNYSEIDVGRVITYKVEEWKDDKKMKKHLNPGTLFCKKNFDRYLNAVPTDDDKKVNEALERKMRMG